jgi:hypothetical protein
VSRMANSCREALSFAFAFAILLAARRRLIDQDLRGAGRRPLLSSPSTTTSYSVSTHSPRSSRPGRGTSRRIAFRGCLGRRLASHQLNHGPAPALDEHRAELLDSWSWE